MTNCMVNPQLKAKKLCVSPPDSYRDRKNQIQKNLSESQRFFFVQFCENKSESRRNIKISILLLIFALNKIEL